MVRVEGIGITGDLVAGMDNKLFEIVANPEYIDFDDKRKAMLKVKSLENGDGYSYYPNKTSINVLTEMYGQEMDEWKEKRFMFKVTEMMFKGEMIKVLYVEHNKDV